MIRDPLYQQIVAALAQPLHTDLFEQCVVDLLREVYSSLVPIRGGGDFGMDGAIADANSTPFPLVCTTSADVIGNLSHSLQRYSEGGGTSLQAVSVTSQALTPSRRRNLFAKANELGFRLLQVHDQFDLADRLYRNPRWCKELLGIVGDRPALSAVPMSIRPVLGDSLVGREADLDWLHDTSGDRLLVGQPGIGKTSLLRSLVINGDGLFVVSDDIGRIQDSIRAEQPRILIVDDAHIHTATIVELRHLRDHTGAGFAIVAATWPRARDQIVEILGLPLLSCRSLERLDRDQIVEVVNGAGISGPVDLIRTIVDQAEGRPGLAVTLTNMCIRGEMRGVALGDALSRSIRNTLEPLVGGRATQLLASLALGGDVGMALEPTAELLGLSLAEVVEQASDLAAAGVVSEVQRYSDPRQILAVRPTLLRYSLIRDVFFNSDVRLPYRRFVDCAPSLSSAVRDVVGARSVGAIIPDDELLGLLEAIDSVTAWIAYSALGQDQTASVLTLRPDLALPTAEVALRTAPTQIIPLLLEAATGDMRPLDQNPEHALRRIKDWILDVIPGSGDGIRRRQLLYKTTRNWLKNGGNASVGMHAITLSLLPGATRYSLDPGRGMTITISRALLSAHELLTIGELWTNFIEYLETLETVAWRHLLKAVEQWVYPELRSNLLMSDDISEAMKSIATKMLIDLGSVDSANPGVLHRINDLGSSIQLNTGITLDPVFELLFAGDDDEDWQQAESDRAETIRHLAVQWSADPIAEVAQRIVLLDQSARSVELSYPRRTPILCNTLAELNSQPSVWVLALLSQQSAPDLIAPFLKKAAVSQSPEWESLTQALLDNPKLRGIAVWVVLTLQDAPESLLSNAFALIHDYLESIHTMCLRGELSEKNVHRMLEHSDQTVAGVVALAQFRSSMHGIPDDMKAAFHKAVVRYPGDEHALIDVLRNDSRLAHDWLREQARRSDGLPMFGMERHVDAAVSSLDLDELECVLKSTKSDFYHSGFVARVVADNQELYLRLLKQPHLEVLWTAPLAGSITAGWIQRARLALQHGIDPEKIITASIYGEGGAYFGQQSDMWRSKQREFSDLLNHGDELIRDLGVRGVSRLSANIAKAKSREKYESVFGDQ